jgi:hypothetical protein
MRLAEAAALRPIFRVKYELTLVGSVKIALVNML